MKTTINVTIDTDTFTEGKLKASYDLVFETVSGKFEKRFGEIKEFIDEKKKDEYSYISLELAKEQFEKVFLSNVLMIAIKKSMIPNECHDILQNAIDEVTEKNLTEAIYGQTMIVTIENLMLEHEGQGGIPKVLNGSIIYLLEKKFFDKNTVRNLLDGDYAENSVGRALVDFLKNAT